MVTSKTFERLTSISPQIANAAGTSEEVVRKVLEAAKTDIISRRRQPAPPPPEGGISIRAAGRKYKIPCENISRWVRKGLIPIILKTKNEHYIDEKTLLSIVDKYRKSAGRGKREIIKELTRNNTPNNS